MLVIAHRGASYDAPENTYAAARMAWEQAADALEIDVHLTRDGRLALIHDPDTLRTAGVPGRVADRTADELARLDVGRWKSPRFAGEPVPRLEEMLALVPAGKRIFVEIKGGPETVRELARCVTLAAPEPARVAIISFDLAGAIAAKRALPACEVSWLADSGAEAPRPTLAAVAETAREAGLDGIDIDAGWTLDRALAQQIRREGFKLYCWTVDDVPRARELIAAGVDGLTTNRPGWLRAQLGLA